MLRRHNHIDSTPVSVRKLADLIRSLNEPVELLPSLSNNSVHDFGPARTRKPLPPLGDTDQHKHPKQEQR